MALTENGLPLLMVLKCRVDRPFQPPDKPKSTVIQLEALLPLRPYPTFRLPKVMYFSCGKSRLHRSAATRRPDEREIRTLVAVLVLYVFAVLFLSELVFDSESPASHEPFLETDATLQSYYDHVRSIALSSGDKKRTLNISSPIGPKHVKRDHEFLGRFGCLVDKGRQLLEDGIVNAAGRYARPPKIFGDDAFRDNGWSVRAENHDLPLVHDDDDSSSEEDDELRLEEGHELQPAVWDEVFRDVPGGIQPAEQILRVLLSQDQQFSNDYGSDMEVSQPLVIGLASGEKSAPVRLNLVYSMSECTRYGLLGSGIELSITQRPGTTSFRFCI